MELRPTEKVSVPLNVEVCLEKIKNIRDRVIQKGEFNHHEVNVIDLAFESLTLRLEKGETNALKR